MRGCESSREINGQTPVRKTRGPSKPGNVKGQAVPSYGLVLVFAVAGLADRESLVEQAVAVVLHNPGAISRALAVDVQALASEGPDLDGVLRSGRARGYDGDHGRCGEG